MPLLQLEFARCIEPALLHMLWGHKTAVVDHSCDTRSPLQLQLSTHELAAVSSVEPRTELLCSTHYGRITILPPALFSSMHRWASTMSSRLNVLPIGTLSVPAATCAGTRVVSNPRDLLEIDEVVGNGLHTNMLFVGPTSSSVPLTTGLSVTSAGYSVSAAAGARPRS